ncbi:hypothetical protein BY996DRAFT_7654621 [Phakopsora pachyrhizi]|nr:hypothetical protein BY996DRAFT_7654621 [Phakopsora pachyrhizi]
MKALYNIFQILLAVVVFISLVHYASCQRVGGQYFTPGLLIINTPTPDSSHRVGRSISFSLEVSGDGLLPPSNANPDSKLATAILGLEIYLINQELNLTISQGAGLLQREKGSSVKHLKFKIPKTDRINGNLYYSVYSLPIRIKSEDDVSEDQEAEEEEDENDEGSITCNGARPPIIDVKDSRPSKQPFIKKGVSAYQLNTNKISTSKKNKEIFKPSIKQTSFVIDVEPKLKALEKEGPDPDVETEERIEVDAVSDESPPSTSQPPQEAATSSSLTNSSPPPVSKDSNAPSLESEFATPPSIQETNKPFANQESDTASAPKEAITSSSTNDSDITSAFQQYILPDTMEILEKVLKEKEQQFKDNDISEIQKSDQNEKTNKQNIPTQENPPTSPPIKESNIVFAQPNPVVNVASSSKFHESQADSSIVDQVLRKTSKLMGVALKNEPIFSEKSKHQASEKHAFETYVGETVIQEHKSQLIFSVPVIVNSSNGRIINKKSLNLWALSFLIFLHFYCI